METLATINTLFCVYAHVCPIDKTVKYIGTGRRSRAYSICKYRGNQEYVNWVKFLETQNLEPEIVLLKTNLTQDEGYHHEKIFIKYYKDLGIKLFNRTLGGRGCAGTTITDEFRKKVSERFKGKPSKRRGMKASPETLEKMRKAVLGRKASDETKRKQSLSLKGKSVKPVICLQSGIVFDSLQIAAQSRNMRTSTLGAMLTGQNSNKTTLKYLNEVAIDKSSNSL